MYKNINVKFLLQLHHTVNSCFDCLFIILLSDPVETESKEHRLVKSVKTNPLPRFCKPVGVKIISALEMKDRWRGPQNETRIWSNIDLLLALHVLVNPAELSCLWEWPNGGGGENGQVQMLLLFLRVPTAVALRWSEVFNAFAVPPSEFQQE